MKNSGLLVYFLWISISRIIKAEYNINDFTSLTGDVQKFFTSLGVFIVQDGFSYGNMLKILLHAICGTKFFVIFPKIKKKKIILAVRYIMMIEFSDIKRERRLLEIVKSFSRQNRMSQVISFDDLTRVQRENTLYALMMNDRWNFNFVINATRNNDLSSHPWLFLVSATSNFNCDDPGSDFFKLKMDSRMVALCEGDKILKSYYGVFDNRTEVVDLAEWTMEKKLVFKDVRSRHDALTNMKGIKLKVANKVYYESMCCI